jgi:hypothetical protein
VSMRRREGIQGTGRAVKAVLLLAICAVSAGIAASAAQAADVNVNPFICNDFQGGNLTVPAGSTITIRQGVSEQTLGILLSYLTAQTTTITVNGTTVDVSDAWPTPERRPQGDWASFITSPTGITLGAGQSLTVVWVTTLAHVVPEVFNPAAGGEPGQPLFNAGSVTYACTVTAS